MKNGDHLKNKNVLYEHAKKISLRSREREISETVDGEPIGKLPVRFGIMPRALRSG